MRRNLEESGSTSGEARHGEALVKRPIEPDVTGCADELSDEKLLDRFLNGRGIESQEAFRALVERHGPMVLGICRHVLNQHHDAEDAFQATFLVLAQKGRLDPESKGPGWLASRSGPSHRGQGTCQRGPTTNSRKAGCGDVAASNGAERIRTRTAAWNELRPVLHAEVERLPERYRVPVILSYLEGKTNEEVAELLRWPVGTVKGRLSRPAICFVRG